MRIGSSAGCAGARVRGCAGARRLTAWGDERFGDSAGASEAVEGEQTALMEQQDSVGDFTHACELVGRDDHGGRSSAWQMSE